MSDARRSSEPHTVASRSGDGPVVVDGQLVRLAGGAWGVALGLLLGSALFLATNVLVLRGGPEVGPHLRLLGQYLPFYSVTFVGSLIGFVEAFGIGYVMGRAVCMIYNRVARP